MGIGGPRVEVEHFLDELAEEVSPSWLRSAAGTEATARAGEYGRAISFPDLVGPEA
jgi:hypothetical protein